MLLARGRVDGIDAYDPTMEDARVSFLAALVCLPVFLLLRWGFPTPGTAGADPLRALAADLIAYVCSWAAFALASLPLAEAMGRRALWPRFIAAWNWTNVVQYGVLGILTLPAAAGAAGFVADALGLLGLGYAIWLQWFTVRLGLAVSGPRAAGFVLLDLAIAVFLSGLAARIAVG